MCQLVGLTYNSLALVLFFSYFFQWAGNVVVGAHHFDDSQFEHDRALEEQLADMMGASPESYEQPYTHDVPPQNWYYICNRSWCTI